VKIKRKPVCPAAPNCKRNFKTGGGGGSDKTLPRKKKGDLEVHQATKKKKNIDYGGEDFSWNENLGGERDAGRARIETLPKTTQRKKKKPN